MKTSVWLTLSTLLLAACSASAPPTRPPEVAGERLSALFAEADTARMRLDPLAALARGELGYADRFGDYITPGHQRALEALARRNLSALGAIERESLSAEERIYSAAFRFEQELALRGFDSGASEMLRQLPLDHLFGYHIAFPDMSSGQSVAPFVTLEDYEKGLLRIEGFATYLDRSEAALREGIAEGHVLHRFATDKVIGQLQAVIDAGIDDNLLLAPIAQIPPDIHPADTRRLRAAYRRAVAERVLPAYRRLLDFMQTTYRPASRTGPPGLSAMRDGDLLYRHLIELHTGTTLEPEAIHRIGLDEVARIRSEMQGVLRQVGFGGSLQDFFAHLRSDPRFRYESRDDLLAGYEAIRQRVEPRLGELFSVQPRTGFEIRPVPDYLEQTTSGAYYFSGSPDGSRPGVFYVNTWDLPSRTTPAMETLFLHEAVPGHHLQASLAQENEALPAFLRFGFNTAFIEGWGLYAESLGPQLGMFEDPYQRFGHLDLEMFRALRLVVDTGLHAEGWSRRQAVDYMLENSSLGRTVLEADVDRYAVWPGQALAYKLGQLTLLRLRAEAERDLGDAFDLREFHREVLDSGPIPLPILEEKLKRWRRARRAVSDVPDR